MVHSLAFKLNFALSRGSNSNAIEICATSGLLALNMGLATIGTVAFPGEIISIVLFNIYIQKLGRHTKMY